LESGYSLFGVFVAAVNTSDAATVNAPPARMVPPLTTKSRLENFLFYFQPRKGPFTAFTAHCFNRSLL
jgi:hypothetical protein